MPYADLTPEQRTRLNEISLAIGDIQAAQMTHLKQQIAENERREARFKTLTLAERLTQSVPYVAVTPDQSLVSTLQSLKNEQAAILATVGVEVTPTPTGTTEEPPTGGD